MPARRRAPLGCGSHAQQLLVMLLSGMGAAAKCQIILARALSGGHASDRLGRAELCLPFRREDTPRLGLCRQREQQLPDEKRNARMPG